MFERNSIEEYKKTSKTVEEQKKQHLHSEILDNKYNMEYSHLKRKDQFFKKGTRDVAFSSSDTKITTSRKMAPNVYQDMVLLAKTKQWSAIKVSGEKEFKRNVWLEASSQGMKVNGYDPTEQDLRMLDLIKKQNNEKNTAKSELISDKQTQSGKKSAAQEPITNKQEQTNLDLKLIKKMAQEYAQTVTNHEGSQKLLEKNVMQRINKAIEKGATPILTPEAQTARSIRVAQPEKSRQVASER